MVSPSLPNYKIIRGIKDHNEYNVTLDMKLEIKPFDANLTVISELVDVVIHKRQQSPLVMKMCLNHNTGYFNGTNQQCYYHYNLYKICLVLNTTTYELVNDYEKGCENQGIYRFTETVWISSNEPRYFSLPFAIEIRSEYDPYLYISSRLEDLPPTQAEYAIMGIAVLVISFLLIFLPIAYFCRKRTQKSNLRHLDLDVSGQNFA